MNTVVYQQTLTSMIIFQHSTNNWKRSPWLCISTISWWEWKRTKPSGTDVREYECYSQDDVNYDVYACLYVVIIQARWCQLLCVCMFIYGYMCEGVAMIMCIYVWSYLKVWRWSYTVHNTFWSGKSRRSGVVKLLDKFKKRVYKNQLRQVIRRVVRLFRKMTIV